MINMLTRYSVRNHSSIVFEVIKTISSLFIYFSYEKILSKKKAQKRKRFSPSWKFFLCAQKCVAFVVFCSLVFVLLVGVCLWRVFQNLFIKKKKKQAWNCPDNLKYYTTDVYPYQHTYEEFICSHLYGL